MKKGRQVVTDLLAEDRQRLDDQRVVIRDAVADSAAFEKSSARHRLRFLDKLLRTQHFDRDQTYELQSMGIVLGDALADALDLKWVMVDDRHGRDPALLLPGTTVLLFPLTMISKRAEAGQTVDVVALFTAVLDQFEAIRAEAV